MPGTAAKVQLTERQMEILETIVASKTAAMRLVQRAQIILLGFQKKNNQTISGIVDLNPLQVGRWRKRWQQKWEHLIQVECTDTAAALRRAIEEVLSDRPRKGRNATFSTQQQAAVVGIACEEPDEASARPISHWSRKEIADEAVTRGVVESISASTVGRFLKSGGLETAPQQVLAVSQTIGPGGLERRCACGVSSLS